VEKNVMFDSIQISLFSFIGILFQANSIAVSIEKLFGFGFFSIDIIICGYNSLRSLLINPLGYIRG